MSYNLIFFWNLSSFFRLFPYKMKGSNEKPNPVQGRRPADHGQEKSSRIFLQMSLTGGLWTLRDHICDSLHQIRHLSLHCL